MTAVWAPLLVQLVGPAVVVAWSPVKIIPALALIFGSVNSRANGLAFLTGSLAGLAMMTAVFVAVPHALDDVYVAPRHTGTWGMATVAAGTVLLVLAALRWRTRHRVRAPRQWLSRFTQISPRGALLLGLFLAVANPKVLAMNAAAGVAIGAAAVGVVGAGSAVLFYTVVAGSTVLVPVVGYAFAADRVDRWLHAMRRRLLRHRAMTTVLTLTLAGTFLIIVGLRAW